MEAHPLHLTIGNDAYLAEPGFNKKSHVYKISQITEKGLIAMGLIHLDQSEINPAAAVLGRIGELKRKGGRLRRSPTQPKILKKRGPRPREGFDSGTIASFAIDPLQLQKLHSLADEEKVSSSELMRRAIKEYLERRETPP
jgi:hypothetical protein